MKYLYPRYWEPITHKWKDEEPPSVGALNTDIHIGETTSSALQVYINETYLFKL